MKVWLFVALLAISSRAQVVCDATPSPRESLKQAQAVFLGVVGGIQPAGTRDVWTGKPAQVSRVVFDVEMAWKGVVGKRFSMFVYSSDARYAKGKKLMVYARKYGKYGLVGAFDCNDPVDYEVAAKKDLVELGPPKPLR